MAQSSIDNLMPREVAMNAENAGVIKANLEISSTFMLAMLAGGFIAFGAVFSTTVMTGNGIDGAIKLPMGLMRLFGGGVFCLGLILVSIAGAEMFTGNVLLVMAAASRKISLGQLLRNWAIVFGGNLVGAVLATSLIFLSGQYKFLDGQVGVTALGIADSKCSLTFSEAFARAVLCNMFVCLAIWLSLAGRTLIDKVAAIVFPISAFVTSGFEHSVANMYFLSIGLAIKYGGDADFWNSVARSAEQFPQLTIQHATLGNLLPVTLGNTVGGLLVGLVYWAIYCRPSIMHRAPDAELLSRFTRDGRRQAKRIDCDGQVSLTNREREFHGRLKNIGTAGMMVEVYVTPGMPKAGDRLEVKLATDRLSIDAAEAVVVNATGGKNLMGREYRLFSLKFARLEESDRAAIAKLAEA